MPIEVTDELVALFERDGTDGDGNIVDTRAGLRAVLDQIQLDYRLDPYCNAKLMPDVACKKPATNSPRHKHEAKLPTGNWVEWS